MLIKDIQQTQRPREKAKVQGLQSLSDIELLALFIRVGGKNSVLDVAWNLIREAGSLSKIGDMTLGELKAIPHIGEVKSIEIKALFEFARRIAKNEFVSITSDEQVAHLAHSMIREFDKEHFIVIATDMQGKVLRKQLLYKGTNNEITISPKEVVGVAIKAEATNMYIVHNHPSGIVKSSKDDEFTTARIQTLADILGIRLMGHLIINKSEEFLRVTSKFPI